MFKSLQVKTSQNIEVSTQDSMGRNKSSGVQLYSHQLKQTRLGNKVNFYNWNFLLNIANRYHCKLQCHHNQNYTKNDLSTNF